MKLEVGMYVRTKNGAIAKIEQIVDDEIHFNIKPIFSNGECLGYNWVYIKDVSKARHNIIDLIQSKDLIVDTKNNLYVVDRVEGDYVFTTSKNEYGLIITLVDYQIKSIVTKEQFESMKYSLEG